MLIDHVTNEIDFTHMIWLKIESCIARVYEESYSW